MSDLFFDKGHACLSADWDGIQGKVAVSIQHDGDADEYLQEETVLLDPLEAVQFATDILKTVRGNLDCETLKVLATLGVDW